MTGGEPLPELTAREMTFEDCAAVSAVRVRGWQFAYAGLMPGPYLDALSVAQDAARRRETFVRRPPGVVDVVAERAGRVVGWCSSGPARGLTDAADCAELYALYVLPTHLSTGVGRAPMGRAVRDAAAAGRRRMVLWVLEGNTRARRFYHAAGFAPDGQRELSEAGGAAVPEVRYSRPLSAEAAASDRRG